MVYCQLNEDYIENVYFIPGFGVHIHITMYNVSLEDIYYTADYAVNTSVSSMSYHSHELVQNSNSSYVQYTHNPWQSPGDFILYSSGSFTSGSFISEDMTIRASNIPIEYLSTNISNITCIGETVVPKKVY